MAKTIKNYPRKVKTELCEGHGANTGPRYAGFGVRHVLHVSAFRIHKNGVTKETCKAAHLLLSEHSFNTN